MKLHLSRHTYQQINSQCKIKRPGNKTAGCRHSLTLGTNITFRNIDKKS